jgi:hypothetical protein
MFIIIHVLNIFEIKSKVKMIPPAVGDWNTAVLSGRRLSADQKVIFWSAADCREIVLRLFWSPDD